jgi:hypothetical protein
LNYADNTAKPAPVSIQLMTHAELRALPEPLPIDPYEWLFNDEIDRDRFCDPLPYGRWTCRDGTRVLFNRTYEPLWTKPPGLPAERCTPHWVADIEREEFF